MSKMNVKIKTALLSVFDKTGIERFAQGLVDRNINIIATGKTATVLKGSNIPFRILEEITHYPELMGGRVKSLHPKIYAGILGHRVKDAYNAMKYDIEWIDLVVCNFYPFSEKAKSGSDFSEIVTYIDIGGPTMLRAAAKNFEWAVPLCCKEDYEVLLTKIDDDALDLPFRQTLAEKAFFQTAAYELQIANYFMKMNSQNRTIQNPNHLFMLNFHTKLRYGENPHQTGALYRLNDQCPLLDCTQLHGKPMSYNNYLDASFAMELTKEFADPTCVIIKHTNPCSVSSQPSIQEAIQKAWFADSKSAFGGVVAINRPLDLASLTFLSQYFIEIILAPSVTQEAKNNLNLMKNCRVLQVDFSKDNEQTDDYRFISGAVLKQSKNINKDKLKFDQVKLSGSQEQDVQFAWNVVKYAKSNAIVIAKDSTTLAIGSGQVSRIDAVALAVHKSKSNLSGAVLASDGFFPFRDSIDLLSETGISTIITPKGSIRDNEIATACEEHGITLIFSPYRAFSH